MTGVKAHLGMVYMFTEGGHRVMMTPVQAKALGEKLMAAGVKADEQDQKLRAQWAKERARG